MAVRIRKDGRILCAAIHGEEPGDTYIPDSLSEIMSGCTGEEAVIVTEPWEKHKEHDQWQECADRMEHKLVDEIKQLKAETSSLQGTIRRLTEENT